MRRMLRESSHIFTKFLGRIQATGLGDLKAPVALTDFTSLRFQAEPQES